MSDIRLSKMLAVIKAAVRRPFKRRDEATGAHHDSREAWAECGILKAEVERLTRERDEARSEAESETKWAEQYCHDWQDLLSAHEAVLAAWEAAEKVKGNLTQLITWQMNPHNDRVRQAAARIEKRHLDMAIEVMTAVMAHMEEGGSFRYFIYDRLGFGPEAYQPMYLAGVMNFTNRCPVGREGDE